MVTTRSPIVITLSIQRAIYKLRNCHVRLTSPISNLTFLKSPFSNTITTPSTPHISKQNLRRSKKRKRETKDSEDMASTSAMSLVTPLSQTRSSAFFNPLRLKASKAMALPGGGRTQRLQVKASKVKFDKALTGISAVALTASMVIPEIAEAAGPGISPSLKNFLLSIASGGVVLTVIIGAVVGVSNFDPVKRT